MWLYGRLRYRDQVFAQEIAEAIRGFNKISENDSIQRPDLLIVARGGGSLEDLWCFLMKKWSYALSKV